MQQSRGARLGVWLGLAVVAAGGWARGQDEPRSHRATISPSLVYLKPGAEAKFKIVLVATRLMAAQAPTEVRWAVNDVPGGNADLGTIDASGVYKAPKKTPWPCEIHVCAQAPEAANRFLWATVIVGDSPPQYKSVKVWSEPVDKKSGATQHLMDPHGIAVAPDGSIIIADQLGHAVHRYTADGKYLGGIGLGKGSKPGEFTEPRMVATDAEGRIFVSDSKGDRPRIQVFGPDGQFLQIFAEKGRPPGMLLRAHGMAFDPQGRLFVVDVDNMRMNVYDKTGAHLYDWGTEGLRPGEFNSPHGLLVDRNSDVIVTGYYGPTQKFNAEGDFICAFCYGDPPDGPVYFHSVAGDRWGNAYVSVRNKEGYDASVQKGVGRGVSIAKFNNTGDFITAWCFTDPEHRESSVAVDAQGRVYALFKAEREMGVEIFAEK